MVKNLPANAGDIGSIPVSGDPWGRKWPSAPVFLPGKHGERSLAGYSPWGHKELNTTHTFHLKKEKKENIVYIYNGILFGHKKNKILPFATIWMTLRASSC